MRAAMRMTFVLAGLLVVSALPALADDFQVNIDCGGSFAPGQAVPLKAKFQNRTGQDLTVNAEIDIQVPQLGKIVFKQGSLTVHPNNDPEFQLNLNLPRNAPVGDYKVVLSAMAPALMTFDDCGFSVQ